MNILALDPGPTTTGMVVYDGVRGRVVMSDKAASTERAVNYMRDSAGWLNAVAIERMQSYGIAGPSLLRTAEVSGRYWQRALTLGLPVRLYFRRDVLTALDVTGKGSRDKMVRERLIEMHGGSKAVAVGRKAAPGPLYGVSSHAWAALAVALTHLHSQDHARQ